MQLWSFAVKLPPCFVHNLGLHKPHVGIVDEAAGGLWVHWLWRDILGTYFLVA